MRSTTDEKSNSRVYWCSACCRNKASSASQARARSIRARDMTDSGLLARNGSNRGPSNMVGPPGRSPISLLELILWRRYPTLECLGVEPQPFPAVEVQGLEQLPRLLADGV